jgi:hypothetical protein
VFRKRPHMQRSWRGSSHPFASDTCFLKQCPGYQHAEVGTKL